MNIFDFERSILPGTRWKAVLSVVDAFAGRLSIERIDRNLATARITDGDGNLLSEGAGKGQDAVLGATAEAIEHYSIEHDDCAHLRSMRCEEVADQQAVRGDGIIHSLRQYADALACVKFIALHGETSLHLPYSLVCPHYARYSSAPCDKAFLRRYSTNSGCAFGCTLEEALLHGVNEVIERHMLSRLYLELTMPKSGSLTLLRMDDESVRSLACTYLSDDALQGVSLWLVRDCFGVTFCLAKFNKPVESAPLQPVGSGCSLDETCAAIRALTELYQVSRLYGPGECVQDYVVSNRLRRWGLESLLCCNIEKLEHEIVSSPSTLSSFAVTEQLSLITRALEVAGYAIFYRELLSAKGGAVVSQVYVPGLERYHLVRSGSQVVPQSALLAARNQV